MELNHCDKDFQSFALPDWATEAYGDPDGIWTRDILRDRQVL